MTTRKIFEMVALLPVAAVFYWSGMKIGRHLAVPASQPPSPGVYVAALISGAIIFVAVRLAARASDRRSEAARLALAQQQLRRESTPPQPPA